MVAYLPRLAKMSVLAALVSLVGSNVWALETAESSKNASLMMCDKGKEHCDCKKEGKECKHSEKECQHGDKK